MTLALGIHDIAADVYQRDELDTRPSLNSSVLRVLLGQSPDHARQRHPRLTEWPEYEWPESDAMKIGSVAHAILLGEGAKFVVFNPSDFYTANGKPCETLGCKEAKEAIAKARAEGKIDISGERLARAAAAARRMEDVICEEYGCWPRGVSERTLLWQYRLNNGTFILCRAMLDRIVYSCRCVDDPNEHVHIFDLKFTGKGASDSWLDKTIASEGWDIQDAFYTIGAEKTLTGEMDAGGPVRFTFIVGETYPPYDTRFVTLPDYWRNDARQDVDRGANLFGACVDTGIWPGRPRRYEAKRPEWLSARRMFEAIEEEA